MTSGELGRILAELAPLRSGVEPIVSLYLDLRWSDEHRRDQVRLFVRDQLRVERARHADSPAHEAIERTLDRVAAFVQERCQEHNGQEGRAGLALFANQTLGLWRPLLFDLPFPHQLALDAMPHLLPLARLMDDVQPAVVVVVHAKGVHWYELALGGVVNEATIERPLPRVHRLGGSSVQGAGLGPAGQHSFERAKRIERHLEELVTRVWRQASGEIIRRVDATPGCRVLLVGPAEVVAAFERELPERVAAAVAARLPDVQARRGGSARDEVLAGALREVAAIERHDERRQVAQAIALALRGGGLAALGPEDVVEAVNERRVRRLIIEDHFDRAGWRCHQCDAIGIAHTEQCPYCGGELVTVRALSEELVARVLAEAGETEVVAHHRALHSYDGVAALLRQARTAGGASATGASLPSG